MRVAKAMPSGARHSDMRMDAHRNAWRRPAEHPQAIMTAVLCLHMSAQASLCAGLRVPVWQWMRGSSMSAACMPAPLCAHALHACRREQMHASWHAHGDQTLQARALAPCHRTRLAHAYARGPNRSQKAPVPAGHFSPQECVEQSNTCLADLASKVSKGSVPARQLSPQGSPKALCMPDSSRRKGLQRSCACLAALAAKVSKGSGRR